MSDADDPGPKRSLPLYLQIIIGMIIGLAAGVLVHRLASQETAADAAWLGTFASGLFLRALQMLVVPLIFASLISGVIGIASGRGLARLSAWTFGYYIATSLIAVIIGLIVVNLIGPGRGLIFSEIFPVSSEPSAVALPTETGMAAVVGVLERAIPQNVIEAAGSNKAILSVIVFSLLFGVFVRRGPAEHKQTMTSFFNALFDVMMRMTMFVVSLAPYGVAFALLAVGASGKLSAFGDLWLYMVTVAVGLVIHGAVVLPVLLFMLARRSPFTYARAMSAALFTAFSTASSNATLPLTMQCAEEAGVSKTTTSFSLPLGATINMDGTALYEVVAVLFVSQTLGDLSLGQQVIVAFTALAASIGAAGIPSAGLVMMATVFEAVGLGDRALVAIPVLLAVDRLLDMARTTINVWSDSTCAAVADRASHVGDSA